MDLNPVKYINLITLVLLSYLDRNLESVLEISHKIIKTKVLNSVYHAIAGMLQKKL